MLKFHQLFSRSTNLNNLLNLEGLRFFETSSVAFYKLTKKSNKYKNIHKTRKSANDPMESEINHTATAKAVPADHHRNDKSVSASRSSSKDSNSPKSSSSKKLFYDRTYTEFRRWEDTELGSEMSDISSLRENGKIFTLMSYNILAQDLLEMHPYLYINHTRDALNWEFRLAKLKKEILILKPDILCLQEVQKDHLNMILDSLKELDFDHVFKKKTGTRSDGCAIFYNKNLFTLAERHTVEYYQPQIEHLDRDNVAIILKLCLKSDPSASFIVSTTHLLYNPRRQDVRLAQIQVLLAELDRVSINGFYSNDQPKRLPIILTGDFNLKPYSAPYRLITSGSLYYYNLTRLVLEEATDQYARLTGKEFLPPRLGITDNCQHFDMINNKYQGRSRLRNTETVVADNTTTTNNSFESDDEKLVKEYPNLFQSGRLTHNLNLTSVYHHRLPNGQKEATTFQEKWITVDYIFYSKHHSPSVNSISEGYLKLLSRYSLPTVDQCHAMGKIPNLQLGSDHLSLAAKFFLQPPKS